MILLYCHIINERVHNTYATYNPFLAVRGFRDFVLLTFARAKQQTIHIYSRNHLAWLENDPC